jgi:hypothetical protein
MQYKMQSFAIAENIIIFQNIFKNAKAFGSNSIFKIKQSFMQSSCRKLLFPVLAAGIPLLLSFPLSAQRVVVRSLPAQHKVEILVGGKPFTTYLYPDTLEKPILYPLRTASGHLVTRGFPIEPRPGERVDHPHHVGMWLTYEDVNGLDFWNNSYAIPADKKSHYGWIRHQEILEVKSGRKGILKVSANWTKQDGTVLLRELTTYIFSGKDQQRTVDRVTTLTAVVPVTFKDAKDGMFGLRVARQLEIPSDKTEKFVDNKGNITEVAGNSDASVNGTYLTSEGETGDDAWATRGRWCMMYGKKDGEMESITIFDHPENPGYPTYWHARGYGLFAANPLGQKIFSNGKEEMNLHLDPGKSVTFRYRVLISNGSIQPDTTLLNKIADSFAKTKE